MVRQISTTKTLSLYETDFNLWIEETVKQLQERDFAAIDLENLIEEVATLGRSEKRELESLLLRLFEHLLKLTYWESEQAYNQKHWKGEIRIFREKLQRLLQDSPSLKPYLLSVFEKCYQTAREVASDKTSLPLNTFSVEPLGTPKQILDKNWYPSKP
jgi:hypothetical protein